MGDRLKIVVAGGAGFLGSHLCERLVRDGHLVLCVDDFTTGKFENIEHLMGEQFAILPMNIAMMTNDVELFEGGADRYYNLACPASPRAYQANRIKTMLTCVQGTNALLDRACAEGARLLQASTSEVYGDPDINPQDEGYWGNVNCWGDRSCYDEGKRAAETLCHDFEIERGANVRVARIFNTYGPRMSEGDGRVLCTFISQALLGEHLSVFGTGLQTRSFCYVDDTVGGLIKLMESSVTGPVNIGNPQETSIIDVAAKVLEAVGRHEAVEPDVAVAFEPLPSDDPTQRCPDITRAIQELGWKPSVGLEEGLDLMVLDMAERIDQRLESVEQ